MILNKRRNIKVAEMCSKQGFKSKIVLRVFLISFTLSYHTIYCMDPLKDNQIAVVPNNTNNNPIVDEKNVKSENIPSHVDDTKSKVEKKFNENVLVHHNVTTNISVSHNVNEQVHDLGDATKFSWKFPNSINSPFYAFIMLGFLVVVYISYSVFRVRENRAAKLYKTKGNHSRMEVKALPLVFETDSEGDEETVVYEHKFVI